MLMPSTSCWGTNRPPSSDCGLATADYWAICTASGSLPHWRMSLWNRTPKPRTHPPALSSPRQPRKPDMAGGSGDAGEAWSIGAAGTTWRRLWASSWRPDYWFDCMTDDLNAEEEEFYFIFSKTSPNKDCEMSGIVKRLWLVIRLIVFRPDIVTEMVDWPIKINCMYPPICWWIR